MAATLNRAVFFDHVRKPLFGGRLSAEAVQGMDAILDACPAALPTDPLAYCLATPLREAGPSMQPIREIGRGRGKAYGKPAGPYKQSFYGRGLVQLTWEANYAKATENLRKLGILKPDEDLVKTPDLAMRPDIACAIMFHGMIEGWFTGKKLSDYFGHGKSNPRGARAIINGSDHAALIAGYFTHFRDALKAAGHGVAPELTTLAPPKEASSEPKEVSSPPAKPKPIADKHAVAEKAPVKAAPKPVAKKPVPIKKRAAPVHHSTTHAKAKR